jgi:hypothetical protein
LPGVPLWNYCDISAHIGRPDYFSVKRQFFRGFAYTIEINHEIFCLQFSEVSLELHHSPKSGKYQISDAPSPVAWQTSDALYLFVPPWQSFAVMYLQF